MPYLNTYQAPQLAESLTDLHLYKTEAEYDQNFAGTVRELRSLDVLLFPFIPSKHARRICELTAQYPETLNHTPHKLTTLEGVLKYAETFRRDPGRLLYVVYATALDKTFDTPYPKPEEIVGLVTAKNYCKERQSIHYGLCMIFPPYRRMNVGAHATALLQIYAFHCLKVNRIIAMTAADNSPAIGLGRKLMLSKDRIGKFVEDHSREHPSAPTDDPRDALLTFDVVCASVCRETWERTGKNENILGFYNVTCPTLYRNTYQHVQRSYPEGLHIETAVDKYDHWCTHPIHEIKSKSVVLVPFLPSLHGKVLHELIESQPALCLIAGLKDASLTEILEYIERRRAEQKKCTWAVVDKASNTICGIVGLDTPPDDCSHPDQPDAEVAPFVISGTAADGVASEVLALLMSFTFKSEKEEVAEGHGLGLARMVYHVESSNRAMIELFKDLGFRHEGIIHCCNEPGQDDEFWEEDMFGVVWEDWKAGLKDKIAKLISF